MKEFKPFYHVVFLLCEGSIVGTSILSFCFMLAPSCLYFVNVNCMTRALEHLNVHLEVSFLVKAICVFETFWFLCV